MVGFIGALSSSLCILILVFITLLLSYIDSMVPRKSMFRIDESTERFPIITYFVTETLEEELVRILEHQPKSDNKTLSIMVGCTYGFDIDQAIANNITVYNAIKINSFDLDLNVKAYKELPFNDSVLNYCFLDFNREHDNG